jgi:hypothetical protein
MPRKRRNVKVRSIAAAPLTPAVTFALMGGRPSAHRIRGWAESAVRGAAEAAFLAAAWWAHGPELTAEAGQHGFVPFAVTHKKPTGDGFRQWAERFLSEHRY